MNQACPICRKPFKVGQFVVPIMLTIRDSVTQAILPAEPKYLGQIVQYAHHTCPTKK